MRVTDADRVAWLAARVTYLEHADQDGIPASQAGHGEGQYWPQSKSDLSGAQIEAFCGLSLLDYIDAQIDLEGAA